MTTEAQIQANNENAQLSTGPKNSENTRFNAVQHGLCSKKFITPKEKTEFDLILQTMIDDLKPNTYLRFTIVERIAYALWDLQRIAEKESAFENNEDINSQIKKLTSFFNLSLDMGISHKDLDKKEELEAQVVRLIFPNEIVMRYKSEAENRLYKAIKAWKDLS
jgi:hypothetical protein